MVDWRDRYFDAFRHRAGDLSHDLKTPLNIAVLNLELLRMRIERSGEQDEKVTAYVGSIDRELRRVARIVDTFFSLAKPPADEVPKLLDPRTSLEAAATRHGFEIAGPSERSLVLAHESRLDELGTRVFQGAAKIFDPTSSFVHFRSSLERFTMQVEGSPLPAESDYAKVFKFYYTDEHGDAELSLAAARIISETLGGALTLQEDPERPVLTLEIPTGEYEKSSDC